MAILTEESVADALRELNGNMAAVGRKFGVTRSSVQEYVAARESLREVMLDEKEVLVDDIEGSFIRNCKEGNVAAQIFFLKTQGRHRGYTERVELSGENGGPVEFRVVFEMPKPQQIKEHSQLMIEGEIVNESSNDISVGVPTSQEEL